MGATGVVDLDSEIARKRWLQEGLLQETSKSFWSPYIGNSSSSVVHQVNNGTAKEGHTVTFDYDGNLVGQAVKNKDTAFGKGEQKKKFSESITVDRYRIPVDNGDKFDGVNIGDLSINEHGDSRAKLADLFIRWKDQALFDAAQSFYLPSGASAPKHGIYIDASSTNLTYANLANIELTLRTGSLYDATSNPMGYSLRTAPDTAPVASATSRAPLKPFRTADGRSIWLVVLDPYTVFNLKANGVVNSGVIAMAQQADLRGRDNMMFKGLLGQIGQLVFVEAEQFFGSSADGTDLEDMKVEVAGLRAYDGTYWTGQTGYGTPTHSRNLILGQNALQLAFGKQPDYKFEKSQDFGIKSESAIEFWMNTQKVNLTAENTEDYAMAKVASMDYSVIPFDVKF